MMRLATVLTPITDDSLALAAQCGVDDMVYRYPGPGLQALKDIQQRIHAAGIRLSVIEGYLPLERIKLGQDDGTEVEELKQLIRNMGELKIPVLCYNFMAGTDWVRTRLDEPARGGALVTAFRLKDVEAAVLLGHEASDASQEDAHLLTNDALWDRLERLLNELIPVAEEAGVDLAMHPDDPPLDTMLGKARIMNSVASFERLLRLVPHPRNGVCFCQGTFAEMGAPIPETIRRLGSAIKYVHCRDVRGTADNFVETFHDDGPTDMAAAFRAYREIEFLGPIRPDHVPQLVGESDGEPGYTMLGRLFAYGYLRGMMQATDIR